MEKVTFVFVFNDPVVCMLIILKSPMKPGKSSAISSMFELVVFDLDDTLAPVMGAVGAGTVVLQSPHNLVVNNVTHIHDYKGNAAMFAFMKEHMIETSQTPPHELRSLMKRYYCHCCQYSAQFLTHPMPLCRPQTCRGKSVDST